MGCKDLEHSVVAPFGGDNARSVSENMGRIRRYKTVPSCFQRFCRGSPLLGRAAVCSFQNQTEFLPKIRAVS
jgi:hypothetical protein